MLPLSLIIIDIDNFKSINDSYGHDIGDEILKEVANVLQEKIRQVDILARWGGEEFLVLAPNTDHDNVQILAEKLRLTIENHHFNEVKNITISLGVSTLKETDTLTELFKRADQGLYYAKEHGKNQVGMSK
jgi:diguanylate cyclase (GGDEF)-like protein